MPPPAPTRIDLPRAGISLALRDTGGEGPALIFIHGLGGKANVWLGQLEAARGRFRAIAYDQRGSGRSDCPPGPYSLEQWVDDAFELVELLGIDRVALIGQSMGCMVAQRLALRLGDRCWALALAGGAIAWPEAAGAVFAQRAALARAGRMDDIAEAVATTALSERCRTEHPELHGLFCELIASNRPEAYALAAEATARAGMDGLERLGCPTLAFAGSADAVTPPEVAEAVAAAVPGGSTATLAGLGHWAMLEDPRAFNGLLLGFLAEHVPDSRPGS